MTVKNVFYCNNPSADHEPLAFVDSRPKRNCPKCKESMLITGHFEDTDEEVILPDPAEAESE